MAFIWRRGSGGQCEREIVGMKRSGAPGFSPLSDAEQERLAKFLEGLGGDALDFEGLDGFFAALIVGPESVMPSEYLPVVWGEELPDEKAFASIEEANAILQLIMRHWNTITGALEREGVYVPAIVEAEDKDVPGRAWARGFMKGVELRRASWAELIRDENEAGAILTIALLAGEVEPDWPKKPLNAKEKDEFVLQVGAGLVRIYRYFAPQRRRSAMEMAQRASVRRAGPKVGRNDPCPCGSGEKFKRCCGAAEPSVH